MKRKLILPILCGMALGSFAQLAPQDPATLYDHMVEVNKEWTKQDPLLKEASSIVTFSSEAERIAMHLRSVRERLAEREQKDLSVAQRTHRTVLLDRLNDYAASGIFPENHVLPYRNPIFIDPKGTACAVGHLMIESGAHELALRIDEHLETAYIREMEWPEIAHWASEQGFTADELAWIQPGYVPPTIWSALGGGADGNVQVLLGLPSGELLVAGAFAQAGGVYMDRVGTWNGSTYTPLGAGMTGEVTCAAVGDDGIYIGGAFLDGISDLAFWNGSDWEYSVVFDGKGPRINALHFHDGELYAAGEYSGIAGIDDVVLRRTEIGWEPVGEVFDGKVRTLTTFEGSLIAGGDFNGSEGPTDPIYGHIARFNGDAWSQVGNGLNASVRCLLEHGGHLYAGGDLYANVAVTFGLARIGEGGMQWEELLPGHADYIPLDLGPTYINSLAPMGEDIVFGGSFAISQMLTIGMNLASWNGEPDAVEPLGYFNGEVNAIITNGTRIITAGDFDGILSHIATTDLATGIAVNDADLDLLIAPNPSSDQLFFTAPQAMGSNPTFRITDAGGRLIDSGSVLNTAPLQLDIRSLSAGNYQVEMNDGEHRAIGRFIKE